MQPVEPLRVGLRTRVRDGSESAPDCIRAVERAARLLESLGHRVEEVDLPALDEPVDDAFGIVMCVAVARDLARWSARTGVELTEDDVEPGNLMLAHFGGSITGADYAGAIERMQLWSRGVAAWWSDHDVLITPTSPEPPVALGELAPGVQDPDVGARMGRLVSFTSPFDITGQPSISLPLHWTARSRDARWRRQPPAPRRIRPCGADLPVGVQLTAAYAREDVLLRVGAQLEEAAPWRDRHPPVSASR